MIGSILAGVGQIGSMIGGAIGSYNNYKLNEKAFDWQQAVDRRNFGTQLEQQSYDRQMQQTMMDREDNAVQRRVADLKASGLSPVLAAGSSAGAGASYKSEAPQVNSNAGQYLSKQGKAISEGFNAFNGMSSIVDRMLSTKQQEENISKTQAERSLLTANLSKSLAETDYIKGNQLYNQEQTELTRKNIINALKTGSKLDAERERIIAQTGLDRQQLANLMYDLDKSKNLGIRYKDSPSAYSFLGSAVDTGSQMLNHGLSIFQKASDNLLYNLNKLLYPKSVQ